MSSNQIERSQKWNFRFQFFQNHGSPKSKNYKDALKTISFRERLLVNINWYGICFGFVYFFVLGLWRKGLSMLGGLIVSVLTFGAVSEGLADGAGIVFSLLAGTTANYAYFLKEIKGRDSWNPLEGVYW
ncbi:DUF2628 domain-containing protein [Acidovorax sp. NPDC077693]|uniref:DUF2628 domain-containing protein n=1 Tax=unclassified Acidovorax TaxID=2684926 RepID=UPI0037CB868C